MERPVAPILWDAFGRSAILAVGSMAVVSMLGLALGVIAAVWRGRWPDHAASIFTYFGVSLPEFYWGLVLILLYRLPVIPRYGRVDRQAYHVWGMDDAGILLSQRTGGGRAAALGATRERAGLPAGFDDREPARGDGA